LQVFIPILGRALGPTIALFESEAASGELSGWLEKKRSDTANGG
jgi:hypothetical protein